MDGTNRSNARTRSSMVMNGAAAAYICLTVISFGATPFMTNRSSPKGGVIRLISITISKSTPNQIMLKLADQASGKKKGSVIRSMLT